MLAHDISRIVIRWAQEEPSVSQVVVNGDRVNRAAVVNPLYEYRWIVAAEDLDAASASYEALGFGQEPIYRVRFKRDEDIVVYTLLPDKTRLRARFVAPERLDALLEEDSLCEVILDKPARYGARPRPTDLSHRLRKPSREEFQRLCDRFFIDIVDCAIRISIDELIPAQFALERARKVMIALVSYYASSESDFTLNLGTDGRNLKAYLSSEFYDHLHRSFSGTDANQLWDALFQACMLFRKAGLKLGENCHYEYPRQRDVEVLSMLRTMWGEN